ncbi:MAG: BatA and WFA domain-containing protein [Phycisphaerales bacterium]|nr:BatA and WFA domain-containing protein [Phycisphaerales bacterium]
MSFLTPWVAAAIGAVVIPSLILLYFLKLRRRQEMVPSTLLWKRATQDLQVNAPFQRLRKNLLLLLQLLILLLAILALARPVMESQIGQEDSVIILLDRSASMRTKEEGGRDRITVAKSEAKALARTFNRSGSSWLRFFGAPAKTRIMVIAFAERASVVCPFTTNIDEVVSLIDGIQSTDGRTNIREALDLAEAYLTQTTVEQTPGTSQAASTVVLLSDGAIPGGPDVVLRSGAVRFVNGLFNATDNVGITSMRFERSYEEPTRLTVLAQVENFGDKAVEADVSLLVDGALKDVEHVSLGAAKSGADSPADPSQTGDGGSEPPATAEGEAKSEESGQSAAGARRPSGAALVFELTSLEGALLEARIARSDALEVDNRAWAVVPAPKRLRALLVSQPDDKNLGYEFLRRALAQLPLEYDEMSPAAYEAASDDELQKDGRCIYDTVIFDKHSTKRLPRGAYLFIGCAPEIDGVSIESVDDSAQRLIWWDDTHPVLRHVELAYVVAWNVAKVVLPDTARLLIEGRDGAILSRLVDEGRHMLILSFAVENSNWWTKPSFPVFPYNAIQFLTGAGVSDEDEPARPGDALRIPLPAGVTAAKLQLPDRSEREIVADDQGVARFAATRDVGVYSVEAGDGAPDKYAVNLFDARESDIRPRLPSFEGVDVQAGDAMRTSTPELWRWFVGAALLFVFFEWYVYNRRVLI